MIIILGVAGSGKSTQGQMLAQNNGMIWLSTGVMLRAAVEDKHKEEMLAGKVLDEDEVTAVLDAELLKVGNGAEVILDGYPRGLKQAAWLIEQQTAGRFNINAIIHLHAHKSAVKERLLARGRQDDTELAITERFLEYENVIKPIIKTMSDNSVPIIEVNAEQTPEAVNDDVVSELKIAGVLA